MHSAAPCSMSFACGGMNYTVPGESAWKASGGVASPTAGPAALRGLVASMVELDHPAHTRASEDLRDLRLSMLDRVYISTPHWLLILMSVGCRILWGPIQLTREGVSDHPAVVATISRRRPVPRESRPLPKLIAHTKVTKEFREALLALDGGSALGYSRRLGAPEGAQRVDS